jgi:hypothetical protein
LKGVVAEIHYLRFLSQADLNIVGKNSIYATTPD